MYRCSRCKHEKPAVEFHNGRSNAYKRGYCKKCKAAYRKDYDARRRATEPEFKKRIVDQQTACMRKQSSRVKQMFCATKHNARKRNIAFILIPSDISSLVEKQQWKCARTGIVFDMAWRVGRKPFAPSVDRIDNTRGYEPGNIQIVCNMYNQAKHVHTDADVLLFAKALVNANS